VEVDYWHFTWNRWTGLGIPSFGKVKTASKDLLWPNPPKKRLGNSSHCPETFVRFPDANSRSLNVPAPSPVKFATSKQGTTVAPDSTARSRMKTDTPLATSFYCAAITTK